MSKITTTNDPAGDVWALAYRNLAYRAEDRAAKRLRAAMQAALNELGVPNEDYPAPVANAVRILAEAGGFETSAEKAITVARRSRKPKVSRECLEEKNARIHMLENLATRRRHRIAELEEIRRFEKESERLLMDALLSIWSQAERSSELREIASGAIVEHQRRLGPRA